MVEPTSVAFAPVWRLAWAMLAVLMVTLALAGWLSMRLSARIARPIAELTRFARRLRETRDTVPPAVDTRISEVGELSRAFVEMLEALERSRSHLVRAGKLAAVGEMAAIMAHEVRTPLGILKSSAQLLERRPSFPPEDRELIGFITSETDRLNRLVSTLLECAAPRAPRFLHHDLHEILQHVIALIASKAEKKGIRLTSDLGARAPLLSCDREQLVQVFLNLVINAIQFAREGGQVGVSTADADGELIARVEDDGPGVAEGELDRVFDPFFTRREGGIGLGLTVVQQIVRAHDGEVEVARGRWGGACFTVRLKTDGTRPQG
jgi:signal transduction histidine kinase